MSDTKIGAKDALSVPATWKEALHVSVHRSEQPAKAIADALGISRSLLDKACDEQQADNLSSRHLPALAAATSDLTWLDFLEAKAGRSAFRLPAVNALCSVQTVGALREFSEFLTTVTEAVADGSVSAEDAARIEREGHEAIAAIHTVMETARRQRVAADLAAMPGHGPKAVGR